MSNRTDSNRLDFKYQGPGRRTAYFEGWYLKFSLDGQTTLALIPSLHKNGEEVYGSLQWILASGTEARSWTRQYPRDAFQLTLDPFRLRLGNNLFSETGIRLAEDDLVLQAEFLTVHSYRRDIMGPFRWVEQSMPLCHGLLVTHGVAQVELESDLVSGEYQAGLYVEKDWGTTFPERYIWVHADFPDQKASIFFSIATVTVGNIPFNGFISNLVLDGKNHTIATWNHGDYKIAGNPGDLRIGVGNFHLKIALRVRPGSQVDLKSPVNGRMEATVRESLSASLQLKLKDAQGLSTNYFTNTASMECHNWFHEQIPKTKHHHRHRWHRRGEFSKEAGIILRKIP